MRRFGFFVLILFLSSTLTYGQSFLSINDILNIRKSLIDQTTSWGTILRNKGYNKSMEQESDVYIYKNCRLVYIDDQPYHSDGESFEADRKTADASYIHFYNGGFNVVFYSTTIARQWINQVKKLGYSLDKTRGGTDRFGSDLYFIKRGKPEIRISEKGTRYMVSVYM